MASRARPAYRTKTNKTNPTSAGRSGLTQDVQLVAANQAESILGPHVNLPIDVTQTADPVFLSNVDSEFQSIVVAQTVDPDCMADAASAIQQRAAFQERLERARELSMTLGQSIIRGDRDAAESVCQCLVSQLAECSSKVSEPSHYLPLAQRYFQLGVCLRELKRDDDAEQVYLSALRLSEDACSEYDAEKGRRQMAACQNHLGLLYQAAGSFQQSVQFFEEALALRVSLLESCSDDEENLVYLGGTLCNLGNVSCDQHSFEKALDLYCRAIDVLDRAIPGCDCGCRDVQEHMQYAETGRPSTILIAQQFLRNSLSGRAKVLTRQSSDQRYRQVRCTELACSTVATILVKKLVANRSDPVSADLNELKMELLDIVSFAQGTVIFDVTAVEEVDADGVALLLHLRGRLVGAGEWPALCGLSSELREATPLVAWDKLFSCFPTVDAALADLQLDD
jgi:tetratricopeptide (TPR) repeat protein